MDGESEKFANHDEAVVLPADVEAMRERIFRSDFSIVA